MGAQLSLDTVLVSYHFCNVVYLASFCLLLLFFFLFFSFLFFDILRDFESCIACLLYITPTVAQRIVVTSEQCKSWNSSKYKLIWPMEIKFRCKHHPDTRRGVTSVERVWCGCWREEERRSWHNSFLSPWYKVSIWIVKSSAVPYILQFLPRLQKTPPFLGSNVFLMFHL